MLPTWAGCHGRLRWASRARPSGPELYIAVGIRGDFNHMVGVQKAGTIIAINNNNNARRTPILNSADYTIIGDWQEYLEPLLEALRPHLG